MAVFVLIWVVCAIGAGMVASKKNRSVAGWGLVGFLLGPIGLLLAACAADNRQVAATLTDQLSELQRLKRRGVITEAEFTAKKAKLLSN